MVEIGIPQDTGPAPTQIGLPWPSATPEFDPGIGRDRAETMSYAGTLPSMTVDDIHGQITAGNEDQLREKAAANYSAVQSGASASKLKDYIDQSNDYTTPEFSSIINEVTNPKQYHPDTVVEQAWAKQFLSNWDKGDGNADWMSDARVQHPEAYEIAGDFARDYLSRQQYAQKKYEEAAAIAGVPIMNRTKDKINPQGVVNAMKHSLSLAADVLTLGVHSEVAERGDWSASLLGTALEDERRKLFSPDITFEAFKEQYDKRFNEINGGWFSNPGVAAHWANAMVGQGILAKDLENVGSALNIGLLAAAPIGGAAKGAYSLYQARKAGSSLINSAGAVINTAANAAPSAGTHAAAAAGNTQAAGAARATTGLVNIVSNNAGQMANDARNAVQSTFGVAEAALRADPGAMGAEIANRLADRRNLAAETFLTTLEQHTKVEGNPAQETSQIAANVVETNMREAIPGSGVNSMILDIKEPYPHPITGVWHRDYIFGDTNGKPFDSPITARTVQDDVLRLPDAQLEQYGRKYILRLPTPVDITNPHLHNTPVGLGAIAPALDHEGSQLLGGGLLDHWFLPIGRYLTKTGFAAPTNLLSKSAQAMMATAGHSKTYMDTILKSLTKPLDGLLLSRVRNTEVAQTKTINSFTSDLSEAYQHHGNGSTTRTKFNGQVMPQSTRTVYVKPEHGPLIDKHFPRAGSAIDKDVQGPSRTFKTSQGSTYQIHEDGTTTRTKAARSTPGHEGDSGLKNKSFRTVYTNTSQEAGELSAAGLNNLGSKGARVIIKDGKASLLTWNEKEGKWGRSSSGRDIPVYSEPAVGRAPLELWKPEQDIPGHEAYSNMHAGNAITELSTEAPPSKRSINTVVDNYDGGNARTQTLSVVGPQPGPTGRAVKKDAHQIPYVTEPKNGLHAVELFDQGTASYRTPAGAAFTTDNHYRGVSLGGEINNVNSTLSGKVVVSGRQMRQDWRNMVERSLFLQNQFNPGKNGLWYNSISEVEQYYRQNYNRLPSLLETEAYFNYKDLMHIDYIMRNVVIRKNMESNGYMQHRFSYADAQGVDHKSDWIYAKVLDHVPEDGHGIVNLASGGQTSGSHRNGVRGMVPATRAELQQKHAANELKILKFWEPNDKPLSGFFGTDTYPYKYAYSKLVESRNLPLEILPAREGGHLVYESPFWLKQAKMESHLVPPSRSQSASSIRHYYMGDTTVMPINIAAKGDDVAKKLNMVREQIGHGMASQNFTSAEQMHNNLGLPFNFSDHLDWYTSGKLNPSEPIFLANDKQALIDHSGANIAERYGKTGAFFDQTKADSDAKRFALEFTEERSNQRLFTLENRDGTGNRPLYKVQDASILDPVESINRAMYRITGNAVMDDAKRGLTYQWLSQAQKYLAVTPEELWAAPVYWLEHAPLRAAGPGETKIIAKLEASRYMIRAFNGVASNAEATFSHISQAMANGGYKYLGEKDAFIGSEHSFNWISNKVAMGRAGVYHLTLGLMNIAAFVGNIAQIPTILSIAGPRRGLAAFHSAMAFSLSRLNRSPAMLDFLDKYVSRLTGGLKYTGTVKGMKPGQWKEAQDYFVKSGLHIMGTEHALMQNEYNQGFARKSRAAALNIGTLPFKASEHLNIGTAWFTAWDEFREAKPLGAPTTLDLNKIIQRTTLLSGNMREYAKRNIEKGIGSWILQFGSYPLRMSEMMMGKQLTNIEKARFMLVTGALYGWTNPIQQSFPLPMTAWWDGHELGNSDYRRGQNILKSAVNEGLMSVAAAYLTGHGDMSKGNWYNFKNRLGGNGFSLVNDFFYSDRTLQELVAGPAGTVIRNSLAAVDPYWRLIKGMYSGNEDEKYHLTYHDMIGPLKTVNALNNAYTGYMAYTTGNWLTRNENVMESGVGQWDAIFMAATGLRHQSMDDVALLQNSLKTREERQKFFQGMVVKEWHQMIQAINDDNGDLADSLGKNVKVYLIAGDWTDEERGKIMSIASGEAKSIIDRTRINFYLTKAPQSVRNERFKMLEKLNIDREGGAK